MFSVNTTFEVYEQYVCVILWRILATYRHMMTSSNGNIFHVIGHLCGEFTGHRWIPSTEASDAEL